MNRAIKYLFLFLSIVSQSVQIGIVPHDKLQKSLQITIEDGIIQGRRNQSATGRVFYSFQGIPYAKPPVNELRFAAPQLPTKWTYVLDATTTGPCCSGLEFTNRGVTISGQEDCLYLNVYTPQIPIDHRSPSYPVIVYLHGGGFVGGCGNTFVPDFFVEREIVLVVLNYRHSVFGYLSTEDDECPGNWAAKDHVLALRWIQTNVHTFGGDPRSVTVVGHSSGAANVNTLLLSKRANGLFHKAVLLSGCSLSYWSHQTQQRRIAFDFGSMFGIRTESSKSLIEQLRRMDGSALANHQLLLIAWNVLVVLTNGLPLTPSLEPPSADAILTEYPYESLARGEFNRVPVLMGVTSNEAGFLYPLLRLFKPFLGLFNLSPGLFTRMTDDVTNRTVVARRIFEHFFNTTDVEQARDEHLLELLTNDAYYRPMRKTASMLARHGVPVYFYRFSHEAPFARKLLKRVANFGSVLGRRIGGAVHGEDVMYIGGSRGAYSSEHLRMARKVTKLFSNFARTGNPTPSVDPQLDNVTWPKITAEKFPYLDLDEHFSEKLENFDERHFEFWEGLFREFATKPYKVF